MSQHAGVQELVRQYLEKKKWVGMICAGELLAHTRLVMFFR